MSNREMDADRCNLIEMGEGKGGFCIQNVNFLNAYQKYCGGNDDTYFPLF